MLDKIVIRGAREHNLKDIDLEIPRGALTVITGVSGSGKSSLAFDTLYAEGQRRYIESLSTYAKQFLERIGKPDVDDVLGISPSIAIQQKNTTRSSRSTVGTATEIYDYLRLLFARAGRTYCPNGHGEVHRHEADAAVRAVLKRMADRRVVILAEVAVDAGTARQRMLDLAQEGYTRFLIGGEMHKADALPRKRYGTMTSVTVVVDRTTVENSRRARILDSIEKAYDLTGGAVTILDVDGGDEVGYSNHLRCEICRMEFEPPRPILFSFNTPYGACPDCRGFGDRMEFDENLIVPEPENSLRRHAIEPWSSEKFEYFYGELIRFCRKEKISMNIPWQNLPAKSRKMIMEGKGDFVGVLPFLENLRAKTYKKYARFFTRRYLAYRRCRTCEGGRLRPEAYNVKISGLSIREVAAMTPAAALEFVARLKLTKKQAHVVGDVVHELTSRLQFMLDVGLYYVTLDRLTKTLSGGEAQRISLANSLGSNLLDVLYVLDEPSIGLHPRDTDRLIGVLRELRERGNTVVVVEHDLDIIREADFVVDLGPRAGEHGGEVVYQGPVNGKANGASTTMKYLRHGLPPRSKAAKSTRPQDWVELKGVRQNNLKNVDVAFPLERFTSVTGVSGSGKSTLVCDVLHAALRGEGEFRAHDYDGVVGREQVRDVLLVDQSPIGKTPRSNPITYIKAFAAIRDVYASQKLAKKRGYVGGRFSFNVAGGRCDKCEGMGYERVEMHFMADMFVRCSACDGQRFNRDTLEVTYRGLNLAQVLELTVDDAIVHFADFKGLTDKLRVLQQVGLGYLRLGQPSTTLSGGESQRMKIARELSENSGGGCVYILDEPTTGLHVDDVETLIDVLRALMEGGNTVIVVEHNPQVILQSDYVIDLGPEGGDDGGTVVATGTPAQVTRTRGSKTGSYLRKLNSAGK